MRAAVVFAVVVVVVVGVRSLCRVRVRVWVRGAFGWEREDGCWYIGVE